MEQIFLWYEDMQENIEPYKKLAIDDVNPESFEWVRSEDIKQGDIIMIMEDERIIRSEKLHVQDIPFDGIAIAAPDKMFQVNMSLLNGEMSPHKKYPVEIGTTEQEVKEMKENEDFSFFQKMKVRNILGICDS